jgi:uncharacterized SAM-binding protein YcdF (DUF218 family)
MQSGTGVDRRPIAIDPEVQELAQRLWDYHHLNQALASTDCVVGLGSYDLRVADRCADLYQQGWAPLILFSGYLGQWTRAIWNRSEAEIFAERAIARGVPADRILLEMKSTNIGENIRFTRELLAAQGLHPRSLMIVSKPSTERRILATCQRIWPQMPLVISSPCIDLAEQMQFGIGENLIHEMVGDIQRIKLYPDLGFQAAQHLPDAVWSAYERLVALGYDQHLIR